MKFSTYIAEGETFYGAATDAGMIALSPDFPQWPSLRDVIEAGGLGALEAAAAGKAVTHSDVTYLAPLPNAGRILCVGVNFPDRNAEYKDGSAAPKHMSLFPRFASGFTGHGQNLVRPPENETLDYEGEVAIVIGKTGRRIKAEDAYDHIVALTLCNEGTIRDWVRHAKFNVTQGKNWDNSAAMGPWLVPFKEASQLDDVHLQTHVNGELRQDDHLKNMMFPIREEIAYISTFMTLQPGDIIDPPRYLKPGDVVEISATGLGTLRNGVEDEA
jgi:2-keto-4-pentenoate hydratase/2-oxohepta-3-ene-1,7-dioic acid hydratase in catechol pathway